MVASSKSGGGSTGLNKVLSKSPGQSKTATFDPLKPPDPKTNIPPGGQRYENGTLEFQGFNQKEQAQYKAVNPKTNKASGVTFEDGRTDKTKPTGGTLPVFPAGPSATNTAAASANTSQANNTSSPTAPRPSAGSSPTASGPGGLSPTSTPRPRPTGSSTSPRSSASKKPSSPPPRRGVTPSNPGASNQIGAANPSAVSGAINSGTNLMGARGAFILKNLSKLPGSQVLQGMRKHNASLQNASNAQNPSTKPTSPFKKKPDPTDPY